MNSLIRSVRPKSLNRRQSHFQHEHETCVLCNAVLELRFERIKDEKSAKPMVREIAECPTCSVRARTTDHDVQ
ncbi:hypothetical protein BH10BDE1_BH10BDE1_11220 [soil metagenome]